MIYHVVASNKFFSFRAGLWSLQGGVHLPEFIMSNCHIIKLADTNVVRFFTSDTNTMVYQVIDGL